MKQSLKPSLGASFLLLSFLFIALAFFLQWKIIASQELNLQQQQNYEAQLLQHQQRNIFYSPESTAKWLASLQHPKGYFTTSQDRIFEPSQLNTNTLEVTRYAIATLARLDKIDSINRQAALEYILRLYTPVIKKTDQNQAGFTNLDSGTPTIKSTLDVLIVLEILDALGDQRINPASIQNFILSQQLPDGGFGEYAPDNPKNHSSLSVTAYASRALDILTTHQQEILDTKTQTAIQKYINSTRDTETGDYADNADRTVTDSSSTFNAFISLWSIAGEPPEKRQEYVNKHMNKNDVYWHLIDGYFMVTDGAFSRYHNEKMAPSLTATQQSIQLIKEVGLINQINAQQIGRYAVSQQAKSGQFGEDIPSTYAAIKLLQYLEIATTSLSAPKKPSAAQGAIYSFSSPLLFMLALGVLVLSFQQKKKQLEADKENLIHAANTDNLTGIYNRKYFEQTGCELIKSCNQSQRKLTLMSISVDELDTINKTKGHLAGDSILEKVVELITPSLHESYIFVRWGGGVFMILAPDTDYERASTIMKKTSVAIAKHNFGFKHILSCSFALTEFSEGDDIKKLTYRVDKMLAQHKVNKMKKTKQAKAA